MKTTTAWLLGLCIICLTILGMCAGGAWLIRTSSGKKEEVAVEKDDKKGEEKATILRARTDVPARTLVRDPWVLFEADTVAKRDLPDDYITLQRIDELTNRVLLRRLESGAAVLSTDLQTREASVAHFTAPGLRAFTIEVDRKLLARGHVLPESRVDVVGTLEKEKEATVLLENVRVLDVESGPRALGPPLPLEEPDVTPSKMAENPAGAHMLVTVEVAPPAMLTLLKAGAAGPLTLALRRSELPSRDSKMPASRP